MEALNHFEESILEKLALDNPVIRKHIRYLQVRERKLTGTGMYVYFIYTPGAPTLDYIQRLQVSATGYLKMEGITDGLIDSLNIADGKIDFLQLVTYDEPWDGTIRAFRFDDKM